MADSGVGLGLEWARVPKVGDSSGMKRNSSCEIVEGKKDRFSLAIGKANCKQHIESR